MSTLPLLPIARAQLPATAPPNYAADRSALTRALPDAEIDTLPGGYVVVTPPEFASPIVAEDARHHWRFSRTVDVYAPRHEGEISGLFRLVVVHYEPDDRLQAQRSGRLIARLLYLFRERFGQDATFNRSDDTADVWLAPEQPTDNIDAGGETRGNQVYIYGTDAVQRSALEWVRTVSHEWGHLTLPAARGYMEPENDAAGYLGERLYLKWLRADQIKRPADAPDDGTTAPDLALYYHRQIDPLMKRWQLGGPSSHTLDRTDEAAMDYYIGAVLDTDEAYGSAVTGRALFTILDVHARDFLVSLRRAITDADSFTVRPPAWVPLRRGTYHLTMATESGKAAHASDLRVPVTIWKLIEPTASAAGAPLNFRRAASPESR